MKLGQGSSSRAVRRVFPGCRLPKTCIAPRAVSLIHSPNGVEFFPEMLVEVIILMGSCNQGSDPAEI
jgi:hypothetical protein